MKIYKITEASDYLGVSINKELALREALHQIAHTDYRNANAGDLRGRALAALALAAKEETK